MIDYTRGIKKSRGNFACKILVIYQRALLPVSRILHTKPRLALVVTVTDAVAVTPLSVISFVRHRAVIRLLWSEGVKTSKIHRKMLAQYGEDCVKVCRWVEMLQRGRTRVVDNHHLGPSDNFTNNGQC